MDLDRKELIAAHPIKKVRDFLKNHFEYEIDVSSAQQLSAEHFGNESEAVLAELIERGWLEKGQRTWTPAVGPATVHATYNRTDLGQRVAIAKLIAMFPRANGDAVLNVVVYLA